MGTPKLSAEITKLLQGTPWGTVGAPPKANPPPPAVDGRTACLRILKKFFSELTFFREGDWDYTANKRKAPIPFQIGLDDIHIEWPDNESQLAMPSIVFLSGGTAGYESIGFVSYIEEATLNMYAPGTVVCWMGEYVESLAVEIWASKKADRRAILSGLEAALSPTEQMYGLRFRVPEYFNQLVSFAIDSREIFDEGDAVLNRRRARLILDFRFTVCSLVNAGDLLLEAAVMVDNDPQTNLLVSVEDLPPTDPRVKLAEEAGTPLICKGPWPFPGSDT